MNLPHAWPRCPEAAAFFERQFHTFAAANPLLKQMAARFHQEAGVNILTLVDHWCLPISPELEHEMDSCGLEYGWASKGPVWEHPAARFPRVRECFKELPSLALAVEDIHRFLNAHKFPCQPTLYDYGDDYQEAVIPLEAGALIAVTRRGHREFHSVVHYSEPFMSRLADIRNSFRMRQRRGDETEVIAAAHRMLMEAISDIGCDRITDEFFAAERGYYMTRNAAARRQYEQQQKLGIGWANHDHHTYRSSRQSFRALMQLFLTLGFEMRERFYAGAEAGWGAQILEHPVSRVVIFADVDLDPEELDIDFANADLPPRQALGTIGLWCALHGSSIAQAGMHHLEAEFDFAQAQRTLEAEGYGVMPPFTDLPMLKQAFTLPEMWQVEPEHLQSLLEAGSITSEQAEKFRTQGAPGSHLEILQRWDGFKGFNKTGVNAIIRATDARNAS